MDTMERSGSRGHRRQRVTPSAQVVDTFPFDGGEVELVVVRLHGAFGGKRMLAVDDLWSDGFFLRTPFAAWQVEDSPELSTGRHAAEDPYRARSYWRFEEPASPLRRSRVELSWAPMAPQLWMLRHGEAVPHDSKPDAERELTPRGRRQARGRRRRARGAQRGVRRVLLEPEGARVGDRRARL